MVQSLPGSRSGVNSRRCLSRRSPREPSRRRVRHPPTLQRAPRHRRRPAASSPGSITWTRNCTATRPLAGRALARRSRGAGAVAAAPPGRAGVSRQRAPGPAPTPRGRSAARSRSTPGARRCAGRASPSTTSPCARERRAVPPALTHAHRARRAGDRVARQGDRRYRTLERWSFVRCVTGDCVVLEDDTPRFSAVGTGRPDAGMARRLTHAGPGERDRRPAVRTGLIAISPIADVPIAKSRPLGSAPGLLGRHLQ